jgi:alkylhydroperoxidase family enzyme
MSRMSRLGALLLMGAGLFPAAAMADSPRQGAPAVAMLSNEECWKRLPQTEQGGGQPLPSWARALAGSIPRTTASLLRVDYVHRARNPLDPKLRAEMRWVAAHANRCAYSEEYAVADGRRAGLDNEAIEALRRGDLSQRSPAEKSALEFARKMTVNSASVTDDEFAALVKHYGEKTVAAMVLSMAYANFEDRLVLCLGSPMEPGGPLPPIDVVFAPGAIISGPFTSTRKTTGSQPVAQLTNPSGKDVVEDDPDWTSLNFEELQARLEKQRNKTTRVRVPSWEEVERGLPSGFTTPNRVVWNLVCLGHQPELAAAWEVYLRTSSIENSDRMDRVFGQSLFWVTTRGMDCSYCMGHCEMGLDLAGLSKREVAQRTRLLAGDDWSSFPPEEQRAYAFARKLTKTPWDISAEDVRSLERDFGPERAAVVLTAACRGHYMTRISNGFQLSLERDNVFREWYYNSANSSAKLAGPAPVPLTRPEMKKLLEESKRDVPRLTPPEPTPAELAAAQERKTPFTGTFRVRNLLPADLRGGFFFLMDGRTLANDMRALRNPDIPVTESSNTVDPSRRIDPDPNMTLDYAFKAMLFWVVSRSNNCVYCMGHNEKQLSTFGVAEDRIAALDGDWSQFTLAERAALALARKLTVAPHTITDADFNAVRQHFNNLQVLEMVGIVTGFNAMNRWTGPLRLTQEDFRVFLTPTSPHSAVSITQVGPAPAGSGGSRCMPAAAPRPSLEPRPVVEAKWAECLARRPRFLLVDESAARALLPDDAFPADHPLPHWVRLLANFPKAGPARIATLRKSETKGNLPPKLKAQLAWVSGRADRAWYALSHTRDRLRALGVDDDSIFAIDQASEPKFTPGERAAFAFARKLTVDPALIDDADFSDLKKYYSDSEIAELIYHVNHDVFFNRVTEAANLPLESRSNGTISRR